jgi:hypothetical protein
MLAAMIRMTRRARVAMRTCVAVATTAAALTAAPRAFAYRPFDGTDADVAALGDFELELGPVQYYTQGGYHYLIAPATVLNLGFAPRWEAVFDFENWVGLQQVPGQAPDRLLDTDALVKVVLLEGSLQDVGPWPSVAVEFGPLLPNVEGENGFGASADLIVSKRWQPFTIHLNNWFELTRGNLNPSLFEGVILEGPFEAPVRPVAEFFVEHEWVANQTTVSGLVGGIWRATEGLDIDAAVREARVGDQWATEIRAGLTWTIGVWKPVNEERRGRNLTEPDPSLGSGVRANSRIRDAGIGGPP